MSKQEHPYAQVLRWIADGETVEVQQMPYVQDRWVAFKPHAVLDHIAGGAAGRTAERFRLKPRTISINGHEVPEPMRVAPPYGVNYFAVSLGLCTGVLVSKWRDDDIDQNRLKRGLCHTTHEAAEAHARALLSFTTTES